MNDPTEHAGMSGNRLAEDAAREIEKLIRIHLEGLAKFAGRTEFCGPRSAF
jgi:hypothetical protein